MKYMAQAGMVCLGLLISVNVTSAQPPEYKYLGGFGDAAALQVCDAFVLGPDQAEKILNIHDEVAGKRREEWQNSGTDFQSMSDEERQKFFAEYRKNVATDMKKECAEALSESELNELEAVMGVSSFTPDAELRAARHLDLNAEQRAKLQASAIAMAKNMVPAEFGFFAPQLSAEERAKAEEAFKKVKEAFTAKAKEVLAEEQQENWKKIAEEITKEIEDQQERFRQFRQNN